MACGSVTTGAPGTGRDKDIRMAISKARSKAREHAGAMCSSVWVHGCGPDHECRFVPSDEVMVQEPKQVANGEIEVTIRTKGKCECKPVGEADE